MEREGPPMGVALPIAMTGGADRSRTDAYGICSPGPYHLATAPCVAVVLLERTRAAWAARSVERVMGFEPTTSTLARLHSTTELHPHERPRLAMARGLVNDQFHGPARVGRPSDPRSADYPALLPGPHRPTPMGCPSGLPSAGENPLLLWALFGSCRKGRRA